MSATTRPRPRARRALAALALLGLLAEPAWAQDPAKDFRQNCASCHTIGGGILTGPDLKGVTKRRDRAWLVRFILDPGAVIDSGDPIARQLLEEARGVRMPPIAGMSRERAEALIDLIEAESLAEKSRFAGLQISTRPFTAADVERGRRLFTGEVPLAAGGAACISCHAVGGLGGLGGGRLGPDLTKVFERYQDRQKLGNWLSAPATLVMQPTFRNHPLGEGEILPLVAYFEHAALHRREQQGPQLLVFALLGAALAVAGLLLFGRLWRWRFSAVRRPLVESASVAARRARAAAVSPPKGA